VTEIQVKSCVCLKMANEAQDGDVLNISVVHSNPERFDAKIVACQKETETEVRGDLH